MQFIIGVFAVPIGYLLSFLYGFLNNYGLTLVVLTIIVRLCLFPLYSSQVKHTVKMADLQPKMTALQKKYANDKETLNIKMMELYKEEKFNPMRGCLPMLIQMPIIFGLFALLRNPLDYINDPSLVMAVHESMFWVSDLSQPDNWILPLGAGLATYVSFSQTQAQQAGDSGAANPAQGMMNGMKYFFPVMIFLMGRSFPAGLALYWFVGNLIQIGQNRYLNVMRKKLKEKQADEKKKKKK